MLKQNTEAAGKTACGIAPVPEILSNFQLKLQTPCYEQWEAVDLGDIPEWLS